MDSDLVLKLKTPYFAMLSNISLEYEECFYTSIHKHQQIR